MLLDLPRPSFIGSVPAGTAGVRAVARAMRAMVRQYKADDRIRSAALDLVRGLAPKAWRQEIEAVFNFVRDRIRYVRDALEVETLQTPDVTLALEQGDCDDKATLLASLLESIGHPCRFVIVGYGAPGELSHVYVETRLGRGWIALDPTMPHPAGWTPRRPVTRMIVHI